MYWDYLQNVFLIFQTSTYFMPLVTRKYFWHSNTSSRKIIINNNDYSPNRNNEGRFSVFREPKDSEPQLDIINYGRIGCLLPGKEGIRHQEAWDTSYASTFSSTDLSGYHSRCPTDDPVLYQTDWWAEEPRYTYVSCVSVRRSIKPLH